MCSSEKRKPARWTDWQPPSTAVPRFRSFPPSAAGEDAPFRSYWKGGRRWVESLHRRSYWIRAGRLFGKRASDWYDCDMTPVPNTPPGGAAADRVRHSLDATNLFLHKLWIWPTLAAIVLLVIGLWVRDRVEGSQKQDLADDLN